MTYYVDESKLNRGDRLGLAYCRLNNGEWDEILGPKPDGYDEMPEYPAPWWKFWKWNQTTKHEVRIQMMRNIKLIIGEANANRCWNVFVLGFTEEEWMIRYINRH